jgi:hypothetical protein
MEQTLRSCFYHRQYGGKFLQRIQCENGGDITGKTIIVEDNTFIENSNAGVYNGASSA